MTSGDVVEVLDVLERAGVDVCVEGGWGVDALLGEQTRAHADLDVALRRSDLDRAAAALGEGGFVHDADAAPGLPARYVLRDERGRQVDVHPLDFDGAGNGWQRLGRAAWGLYPAGELAASGSIASRVVRCITPELQLRFHLGWELDEKAERDLRLLGGRFGLPLPPGLAGA